MDLRIGITRGGQVIEVELADNTDRDALRKQIDTALGGDESSVLWITDKKGKELAVSSANIAFVQIGSEDSRSIGFGA